MRLGKQIAALTGLAVAFLSFDITVYNLITKRYIDRQSDEMKSRSVAVSEYLPFTADSGIVHISAPARLSGDLPVLDGAAALFPVYSAFADALYPAESVSYDGTDFSAESAVQFSNTRGAYQAVADGTADVIFCAKPSAEQLQYAEEKGAELKLVPIGCEAFVFLVSSENPVDNLTVEQVRGIYSGAYTRWSDVGGDRSFIDAVQRNAGSGSQTAMLSFMGETEMHRSLTGALFGRAIGYSFRYYTEGLTEKRDVKMLSLNGVYPDAENIANGSYPVSSNFYAVYDAANPNPNIQLLLDFILSDDGQRIVRESGYVPLQAGEAAAQN